MGVSVNLIVNQRNGVKQIKTLLTEGLGLKVIETDLKDDHAFLSVEHRNQVSRLYIAKSQEYGGLDATIISSGSRDVNIALFRDIAKVLGGFLQETDYDSNWESFQEPHSGNARFVVEHTILAQGVSESKEFSDKIADAIGYESGSKKDQKGPKVLD